MFWRFHTIEDRGVALIAPRDPEELFLERGRDLHLAPAGFVRQALFLAVIARLATVLIDQPSEQFPEVMLLLDG